jgi:hypothetical protein
MNGEFEQTRHFHDPAIDTHISLLYIELVHREVRIPLSDACLKPGLRGPDSRMPGLARSVIYCPSMVESL